VEGTVRKVSLLLLLAVATLGTTRSDRAIAQVLDPIQYSLEPASQLEYGCFGPCACPILGSDPLKGDFTFYRTSVDPLYEHYALLNINWIYAMPGSPHLVHIRGKGTYDIGGEVARMQRMTLDIVSDDSLAQHFDSGLVPIRAPFPVIDIDVRVHADTCRDSVIRVQAAPTGVASAESPPVARLLESVLPNPSFGDVAITFAPERSGSARVEIVGIDGRVVARLLDGTTLAGPRTILWDGLDSGHRAATPGIYWVVARAGDRVDRRRIIRLQ